MKSFVAVQNVKSVGLESPAGEMEKKSYPEMKVPPNYKRYLMGPKQAGRFCFIIRTTKTQTNFTKENYPRRFKSGVAPAGPRPDEIFPLLAKEGIQGRL